MQLFRDRITKDVAVPIKESTQSNSSSPTRSLNQPSLTKLHLGPGPNRIYIQHQIAYGSGPKWHLGPGQKCTWVQDKIALGSWTELLCGGVRVSENQKNLSLRTETKFVVQSLSGESVPSSFCFLFSREAGQTKRQTDPFINSLASDRE